jgi:hypothetical protein
LASPEKRLQLQNLQHLAKRQESPEQDSHSFKLTPNDALEAYGAILSPEEKKEILKYQEIFFIGSEKSKEQLKFSKAFARSCKGDGGSQGLYKAIVGDHICFRYEIVSEIGRGAFGQVFKCLDHKNNKYVAIKINRNDP